MKNLWEENRDRICYKKSFIHNLVKIKPITFMRDGLVNFLQQKIKKLKFLIKR